MLHLTEVRGVALRRALFQAWSQTPEAVPVDRGSSGKRNAVVVAGGLGPLNLDRADRMRDALQFQRADRYKLDGRVMADHCAHRVGCQDLTTVGRRAQAGCLHHGIAEVVAVVFGRFLARDADPNRERNRGSARRKPP